MIDKNIKHKTREAWLEAAVSEMMPLFKQHGYTVPPVRVACGWPVRGGLGKRNRVLGECWNKDAATDNTPQIFISPWLVDTNDVLPTLVHEVVHAVVGHKENHNKVFGKCARAVGLEGKLTATHAGEALLTECKSWMDVLGEYPHAKLDGLKEPSKKQSTRLIKCVCEAQDDEGEQCGYTCRTTKKWINIGTPICPVCNIPMSTQAPAGDKEDEDNE